MFTLPVAGGWLPTLCRLDIDQRCAVNAVKAPHREPGSVYGDQIDDRRCDRIRPDRRSQGEGAAGPSGVIRGLQHEVPPRLMHPVQDLDLRSARQALQRERPARIDIDDAFWTGRIAASGTSLSGCPWRADSSYEIEVGIGLTR